VPTECTGTLSQLASTFGFPYALAVDSSFIYWINEGTNQVLRCSLPSCGGGPEIFANTALAGKVMGLSGLALHGGTVNWTDGLADGGGVFQCATTGCGSAPVALARGQAAPSFIAVDDSGVYWSNYGGGTVMRCPLSGCTEPTPMAKAQAPFAIALDPVSIYFTSSPGLFGSGIGKVFRVAK
jgi:hypothetical protein